MPATMKVAPEMAEAPFSLNPDMLWDILQIAKPFGHHENRKNLNLGFGFIYYGVVRALRPQHVVVIGSGYGFSVVCLALALKDMGRAARRQVERWEFADAFLATWKIYGPTPEG